MPRFVVKFSATSGRAAVHSPECRNAKPQRGYVVTDMDAPTARIAADDYDAQEGITARGYPLPAICSCCWTIGRTTD